MFSSEENVATSACLSFDLKGRGSWIGHLPHIHSQEGGRGVGGHGENLISI